MKLRELFKSEDNRLIEKIARAGIIIINNKVTPAIKMEENDCYYTIDNNISFEFWNNPNSPYSIRIEGVDIAIRTLKQLHIFSYETKQLTMLGISTARVSLRTPEGVEKDNLRMTNKVKGIIEERIKSLILIK